MKYDQETLDEIRDYNPHELAHRADSHAQNGEAYLFFESIRDAVLGHVEYVDAEDWEREMVENYSGQAHEIADGAPDVYTWTKWQEFVGTQAWQEDLSELGFELGPQPVDFYSRSPYAKTETTMDDAAGVALYMIASRLVAALAQEIQDSITDDEES